MVCCKFASQCWRPLCPHAHPKEERRAQRWAELWTFLAKEETRQAQRLGMPRVRRNFSIRHYAVTDAAPAPLTGYAEPAVADTASASADVYVAPAFAVSYAAPAPVIEYAAELAATDAAPALVNGNVAPAPVVSRATPAPVIEYAADHTVTCTAPAPVNGNVASALGDEELVDLPEEDMVADPLRRATIKRVLDGVVHYGEVEEIEQGKVSHDRLYRVKYTDGDIEHFIADQVKEMSCPLQDFVLAKQAQAPYDHLARNVRPPEDRRNAEHTANAVKRDIAESPAVAVSHATPAPMIDHAVTCTLICGPLRSCSLCGCSAGQ